MVILSKTHSFQSLLFTSLVVFVFPILIILKEPGSQPFSYYEITILISVIALAIFKINVIFKENNRYYLLLVLATLIFILYQFLLIPTTSSWSNAIASISIHNKYILLAIILMFYIRNVNEERALVILVVLSNLVLIYYVIFKLFENPGVLKELYGIGGFKRESALLPNTNMFGVYTSSIIPLQLAILEDIRTTKRRWLFLLIVIFPTVIVLILTFSRRAWVGLFIAMVIYLLLNKNRKYVVVVMMMLVIFISFCDYETMLYRCELILDGQYSSNSDRINLVSNHIDNLSRSGETLLCGLGPGSVGTATGSVDELEGEAYQIDIYYLQLFIEYGLIGLFLYGGVVLIISLMFVSVYKKNKNQIMLAYYLSFLIFIISALVGLTPISFPTSMLQWIIAGLITKNFCSERGEQRTGVFINTRNIAKSPCLPPFKRCF